MAKKRGKHIVQVSSKHKHIIAAKKPSHESHVKSISYDYEGRRKRLEVYDLSPKEKERFVRPIGIKVLTAYLGIMLFFYLTYMIIGLRAPIAVLFGQIISGWPAMLLTLSVSIILSVTIYSITKRKKWGYHLSLAWFTFGIINSVISLALLKSEIITVTRNFLILSSAAVFLINIIAIIYIASEKQYFFAEKFLLKSPRMIDKIFVMLITLFILSVLITGSILGYDFYRTNIQTADSIISELEGKTSSQQENICNLKQGSEKDLCILIITIKTGTFEKCKLIESEFYRLACMRA